MLFSMASVKQPRHHTSVPSMDASSTRHDISSDTDSNSFKLIGSHQSSHLCAPENRFNPKLIEHLTEKVLVDNLRHVEYNPATCKDLSHHIASLVMEEVKKAKIKRYKLVAVVTIGSITDRPGMQFGTRCLWNQDTDSFASVKFTNGSIFAIAMVYGMYFGNTATSSSGRQT